MNGITLDKTIRAGNVQLGRGNIISSEDIAKYPGDYPIYSSSAKGSGEFGRYGHYMFDEELITWSVDGGGRFFFRPKHKFSVTNVCGYMHVDGEKWNRRFVYYALDFQHQRITFDYQTKAHPSVIRHLYSLPSIPEPEQHKIAEILSIVDQAIEQTEALIAKQQRIKTGLMQDLLTRGIDEHGNLRSEQTHQFKDSPLGRIPLEWEIGIGSDYFTLRAGIEIEGVSQSPEGDSLYLKVDDLNSEENLNGILFSENTFDCAGSLTTRLLQPGTIVFPKRGAAIFLNRVALLRKRATLDPNLMGLCTKPRTSPQYFRLVLLHRNLGTVCDNSGIPQINNKHLYPLMFAIPDIDEQDRVVTQIHQSEKLLHEHLQQVLKLRSVKTALMQDLLTGNRRVHSGKTKLPVVQQRPWHCRRKGMKKGRWTPVEQKQMIGSAMAIATTANLLLGLRGTKIGKKYTGLMVKQAGMDKELCDAGTKYILIPMLPFAVELCLKGIKAQGGNEFIWTHNLKSLWEDLNKKEQAEVRKRAEDPAWRKEERKQRKAFGITGKMRKVDEVIEAHQNDFEDWRYVADGVKKLTKKRKALRIDEAFMDLFRIVHACVEFHKERDKK